MFSPTSLESMIYTFPYSCYFMKPMHIRTKQDQPESVFLGYAHSYVAPG